MKQADHGNRDEAGIRAARWAMLLFIVWLGSVAPHRALALSPETPLSAFHTQSWYSDDGLAHNTVLSIAQSQDGYLWLGSWAGISRYSGQSFRIYNPSNTPALSSGGVRAIVSHPNGSLFATTTLGGLLQYLDGEWRKVVTTPAMPTDQLFALAIGPDQRLWVGTQGHGFFWLDPKRLSLQSAEYPALEQSWVQGFAFDESRAWIATARGTFVLEDKQLSLLDESAGLLPKASYFAALKDRQGQIWIASEVGLFRSAGGISRKFARLPSAAGSFQSLTEDRAGNVWAGSQSHGLYRFTRQGKIESLIVEQGLSNNRVMSLLEDSQGNLWVGTNAGLNRLNDTPFQRISQRDGLRDEFVRSIAPARDATGTLSANEMWIGTSAGLHRFDGVRANYIDNPEVAGMSITSVQDASDGKLYVGSYDQGLLIQDRATQSWQSLRRTNSELPSNQIRAILQLANGSMVIGTAQGLMHLNQQGQRAIRTGAKALPTDYVLSLHQDRAGDLWVGTTSGVARYQNPFAREEQIHLFHGASYPYKNCFDLFEDRAGNLLTANSGGLLRLNGAVFLPLPQTTDSDPTNFAGYIDPQNTLWLTSNSGLIRQSYQETSLGSRMVFKRAEGLSGEQINGSSDPSINLDGRGRIWLPTARGVTIVDPLHSFEKQAEALPVVIERVEINDQDYVVGKLAQIESGKHRYDFQFAAITFNQASPPRYRYRLLGFEESFSAPLSSNRVAYTNLSPGNYEFEVQASTGDVWQSSSKTALQVNPRLWERLWFIPSMILASMGILFGVYRWKRSQQLQYQATLEREVESKTQDLTERHQELEQLSARQEALLVTVQEQKTAFEKQAKEDALTGLLNRRYFRTLIDEAIARSRPTQRPISIALVDVDLFKQWNDQFGHSIGDQVLIKLSMLLREKLVLHGEVCRYGGEEFVFYLENMPLEDARAFCDLVRKKASALRIDSLPQQDRALTLTIGVTCVRPEESFEQAITRADLLLYQGKNNGRNQTVASE